MNDVARYDALLEAGREPAPPCRVCTGEDAEPCSEECAELAARCDRERLIRGLYEDARRALSLARQYRVGDFHSDARVRAIVLRIYFIRQDIAALRAA
jgi:hypothetical protein